LIILTIAPVSVLQAAELVHQLAEVIVIRLIKIVNHMRPYTAMLATYIEMNGGALARQVTAMMEQPIL
jgi:hypothetical protein